MPPFPTGHDRREDSNAVRLDGAPDPNQASVISAKDAPLACVLPGQNEIDLTPVVSPCGLPSTSTRRWSLFAEDFSNFMTSSSPFVSNFR